MKREAFLNEADRIVCHDRENQYGSPEDNFQRISDLWSCYLRHPVSAADVAIMMTLLKIARIKSGMYFKADSWVDAIGYLACGGEVDSINRLGVEPTVTTERRAE